MANDNKTHQVPPSERRQLDWNDGEMLEKGHDPPSGGQAKAPVESAFVDVETASDKMACPHMGVKLDLPFFGNLIFFPELLTLQLAHPLVGDGRGRVVFPLNELHVSRVKPSKSGNSHEKKLKVRIRKMREENGVHANTAS